MHDEYLMHNGCALLPYCAQKYDYYVHDAFLVHNGCALDFECAQALKNIVHQTGLYAA